MSVTFPAPTTTGGVSPVQVSCNRMSGSAFPVGATPVQCTATDAVATTRSCTFTVTVTAPTPRLQRTRFLAFGDSLTAGEITMPSNAPARGDEPNYRLIIVPSLAYPTVLATMLRSRYGSQSSVIEVVNARPGHLVFLLWGAHAQSKQKLIDATRHLVLKSAHPSPLSAHRGFLGNGHFSRTNKYLEQCGLSPIDWRLPPL